MSKFNEKAYEATEEVTVVETTEEVETKKAGFLSKVCGAIQEHGKFVAAVAAAMGVVGILVGSKLGKKSDVGYEPEMDDYEGDVEPVESVEE